MGLLTIKKQSAASVPNAATDELRLFVDSADDTLKTKDDSGLVRPSGVGTADELATSGSPVDVSASAPPTTGYLLTADNATTATWKTVAASGINGTVVATVVGPTTYAASVGEIIPVNDTAGLVTVNLPTAAGIAGSRITVKLVTATVGTCVIDGNGAETIDGAATFTLNTDYEWAVLVSDGTNWMILG